MYLDFHIPKDFLSVALYLKALAAVTYLVQERRDIESYIRIVDDPNSCCTGFSLPCSMKAATRLLPVPP